MTTQQASQSDDLFGKALAVVSTILGTAAVIFWTPEVFAQTREPVMSKLIDLWGLDIASWLIWVVGGLEALGLFWLPKMAMGLLRTIIKGLIG